MLAPRPCLPGRLFVRVSTVEYFQELEQVQDRLDAFYNGNNFQYKRHSWDAKRARHEEFRTVANRLLNAVGGSIGRKRAENDKVVIGIGLGKFKSTSRLTSLHESFLGFFVSLVSQFFIINRYRS